jgi:hypothetical protein
MVNEATPLGLDAAVAKLIGVPAFVKPPLFVIETTEVPSLARVTVNVCAAVASTANVSVDGETEPPLVAAGVTTTVAAIVPSGVTVNVEGDPFTPEVGPERVNIVVAGELSS